MFFIRRQEDCFQDINGDIECVQDDGFWYTRKGEIIKWSILLGIFAFFMLWFVGGYMHAKRRMRKGLPLLAYHRWLVPYRERQRYGQTPQNHFTFYATQPYQPNADGTYNEPPPLYNNDMPPSYMPPPGASKLNPIQTTMEMQPGRNTQQTSNFGPIGAQETGIVGGGQRSDLENQSADLPPRPPRAKIAVGNAFGWLRK